MSQAQPWVWAKIFQIPSLHPRCCPVLALVTLAQAYVLPAAPVYLTTFLTYAYVEKPWQESWRGIGGLIAFITGINWG